MNLGILSYIKSLEGYNDHKPIIALSTDVFENYYDYFIINGNLFIISVQQVLNNDIQAIYTLTAVNPKDIESIYIDNEIGANIATVANVTASEFKTLAKTIIEGLASGQNNYDIPYTSATININDKVVTVNETAVVSGELFSIENSVLDAAMFANTGSQGEIYKTKRIISELSNISTISVPLNSVMYTPFKDVCGEEILTIVENYLKKLGIEKGTPMTKNRAYHKGEHVYIKVNRNGVVEKRYYVSKIEGNPPMTELPTDDSAWIDITDDVTGASESTVS